MLTVPVGFTYYPAAQAVPATHVNDVIFQTVPVFQKFNK